MKDIPLWHTAQISCLWVIQRNMECVFCERQNHYERIIYLCKRMYTWKYSSDFAKKFAKDFALETINLEIPMKRKYSEFFENEFFGANDNKNKEEKKERKKKNKEKNKKKEVKQKKAKKAIIKDIDDIDGFLDDDL